MVGDLATKANDYLGDMVRSLRKTNPNVRYVIRNGPPAKAIAEYARQIDAQQIVMATRGPRGLREATNGSVAEHVLHATRRPVLMVHGRERAGATMVEPKTCCRVVVPLDGSSRAEEVLSPVSTMARALGCEIFLFQVAPVFLFESSTRAAERITRAYLNEVAGPLQDQGLKVSVGTGTGGVAQSIMRFAEKKHADLIAMSTHGRGLIGRWTLGSVADRVLEAGRTPVLLVRATGRPLLN